MKKLKDILNTDLTKTSKVYFIELAGENTARAIKNYLGEIIIIIGAGVLSYNIFNFSHKTKIGTCLDINLGCEEIQGVAYYYTETTLLLISISAMLITAGLLIIKRGFKYGK